MLSCGEDMCGHRIPYCCGKIFVMVVSLLFEEPKICNLQKCPLTLSVTPYMSRVWLLSVSYKILVKLSALKAGLPHRGKSRLYNAIPKAPDALIRLI